jgi:hypothetical protein
VILDEDWNIIIDDEETIAQKRKMKLIERRNTLLKMLDDHEIADTDESTVSEEISEIMVLDMVII